MESRPCVIRIALPIIGVAAMLMSTTEASAQACSGPSSFTTAQALVPGTGARPDASRLYITPDLQFRSTHPRSAAYAPPFGFYGYSHYGPIAGTYTNHYGYYVRPYVRWTPHFGWVRHRFRRPH